MIARQYDGAVLHAWLGGGGEMVPDLERRKHLMCAYAFAALSVSIVEVMILGGVIWNSVEEELKPL